MGAKIMDRLETLDLRLETQYKTSGLRSQVLHLKSNK